MPTYRGLATAECVAVDDEDALAQIAARYRQGLFSLVDLYEVSEGWRNLRVVEIDPTTGIQYHGSADS